MAAKVENVNPQILRKCREQIGLRVFDVEKKVGKIDSMERGILKPTFNQLDTLADLYKVPRWVFVSDSLPEQYRFSRNFSFRKFKDKYEDFFGNSDIRRVTAMVERLRDLIIELRKDMAEPVEPFDSPVSGSETSASVAAARVRGWLGCAGESLDFREWKEKLEEKNIFIFTTSKYKGWSHVGEEQFRGLAIYHSTLPIIIINNSDAKKARTFSLFHELGHLLRKKSEIAHWRDSDQDAETWCDELAANVLMPSEEFRAAARKLRTNDLKNIGKIAGSFKVSRYACLVRMKQLEIIGSDTYQDLESELQKFYEQRKKELKERDIPLGRNRADEVLDQYGYIYTKALFQVYHNNEIGLHKLCRLFGLKRASDALQLEKNL